MKVIKLLCLLFLTGASTEVLTVNPGFQALILRRWKFSSQGVLLCTTVSELCPQNATGSSKYVRAGTGVTAALSQTLHIPSDGQIALEVTVGREIVNSTDVFQLTALLGSKRKVIFTQDNRTPLKTVSVPFGAVKTGKRKLELRLEYDSNVQSETALFLDDIKAKFTESSHYRILTIIGVVLLALTVISLAGIWIYIFWHA